MTKKIIKFLKKDRYVVITVSIFYLLIATYTRLRINSDQIFQFGSVFNFFDGNGLTCSFYNENHIYFYSVNQWPYLYRLIVSPILYLTQDLEITAILTLFFSYIFLICALKAFFKNESSKDHFYLFINICTLFIAFCVAPFKYGTDVDIIALSIFLLLVSKTNDYYHSFSFKDLSYAGFLIILLINLRYLYIPIISFYLLLLIIKEIKYKQFKINLRAKIFFMSFLIVNLIFLMSSQYFSDSTSSIVLKSNTDNTSWFMISSESYWSVYSGLVTNGFFPDFILYKVLFLIFEEKIFQNYTYFVFFLATFGAIIFLFLLSFIKKQKQKIFLLLSGALGNIILLSLVFKNHTWPISTINDINLIIYDGLTTFNRYSILIYSSIFIYSLIIAIQNRVRILRVMILLSFVFGLTNTIYLQIKFFSSRSENMNLMNSPNGSYNDCVKIGEILKSIKNEEKTILFNKKYQTPYRQISPTKFAQGLGITISSKSISPNFIKKQKTSLKTFDKILLCDLTKNMKTYEKDCDIIYKGKVYSLFLQNSLNNGI